MSIAYLDPGNIAGDLEAGTSGGYKLIWTLMWATALGWYYQVLSAKIGCTTQRNLAKLCHQQYPKYMTYILWIMTEFAIIGSDIQEVIGSATALNILFGIPLWSGALITIVDSFLFLFIHYYGVRKLEAFFAFLISVMTVCFMVNMIAANPDYKEIALGALVPRVPSTAWSACLGLIGAVIMPHNLYLHSSLVLTRKIDTKKRNQVKEANIYNAIESAISLFISFVISTCVIATFAVYLEKHPETEDLDLQSASEALSETFGKTAKYIWAVGLLAAGQSSTMTGTYAGQFVMEGFLDFKLPVWQRVLITRAVAIVPALCVLFLDIGTLTGMDTWLNILQSIQLPFALIPTIKFASSPLIMGEFAISRCSTIFASCLGVALFLMNFVIIFTSEDEIQWWAILLIAVGSFIYLVLITLAIREPIKRLQDISILELNDHEYERINVEGFDVDEDLPEPVAKRS